MENTTETLTDTIQDVEETNVEVQEEENVDTPQETEETDSTETTTAEEEPFRIRYNHEDKDLTRDEAIQYAQKGFKYDAVKPTLDRLAFLSATKGKGAQEWLEELITAEEEKYREELIVKYDGDFEVVDLFMKQYKAENEAKYNKYKNDKAEADSRAEKEAKQTLESRIASEFVDLQKEFPEITDVTMLPKAVLEQAKKGKDLTDAFLRYKHQQTKRIGNAKQNAKANASASTGAMTGDAEQYDSVMEAFLKGLR